MKIRIARCGVQLAEVQEAPSPARHIGWHDRLSLDILCRSYGWITQQFVYDLTMQEVATCRSRPRISINATVAAVPPVRTALFDFA